jgi:hypothetical protein
MVDIETMGKRPGCAIVAIGAVAFNPIYGTIGETFERVISLPSCLEAGFHVDGETVMWWMKQNNDARGALMRDPVPIALALSHFSIWFAEKQCGYIWGHGSTFDVSILEAALHVFSLKYPWQYNAIRDTRTLYELAGVWPDRTTGTLHKAVDDAMNQAIAVNRGYVALGKSLPMPKEEEAF